MIMKMLTMQDNVNSVVNPEWKEAKNDWLLAAAGETWEAIEHHGWKWWKHQEKDMDQLRMEIVDIWHFLMSELLIEADGSDACTEFLFNKLQYNTTLTYSSKPLLDNLKALLGQLANGSINVVLFFTIAEQAGIRGEDLYKLYIGKNVLNRFRQDNGYKEGTYVKVWEGREDNEWLTQLLETVDAESVDIEKDLTDALKKVYEART